MKRPFLLLMIVPTLLLASCSLFGDDDDVFEVERQRVQWERLGIDAYEYDLTRLCFCPYVGAVRIQVRADTVHSATVLETGESPDPQAYSVRTIDELFRVVLDATKDADKLDVEYDATFHYPLRVNIDYLKDAVDDEVTYIAENFRSLRTP